MIRERAPWTLRRRLVTGLVGLVAAVSLLVGLFSALAMYGNLMDRLDGQLDQTAMTKLSKLDPDDDPAGPPPSGQQPQGPGPGDRAGNLLIVLDDEGVDLAQYVDESGTAVTLPPPMRDLVIERARAAQGPISIDLGQGLGTFRVIAKDDVDTTHVVVSGISTSEVTTTITNFVLIYAAVALGALALAAWAGASFVRSALRPLERVAATATRVSERSLAEGEVRMPERVPDEDTDERTEVGQVGSALNRLLGHVEGALTARQDSEQRLRRFVADASHELRTPLASIRGYTELSQRDPARLSEEQQHSLERIGAESGRMTVLVEDLLLLARLDAGQPLRADEVDVARLAVDVTSDAQAADRGNVWVLDVPEEGVPVTGDPGRLHQLLANLLANARTHTPDGTTVTTTVETTDDEVVLRVVDDGPGIDADLLPDVFGRFVRGDGSRARRGTSSGLGLSICLAIARSHGGSITVESEPGRTAFEVRLPAEHGAPVPVTTRI